jgi:hypothetical protein
VNFYDKSSKVHVIIVEYDKSSEVHVIIVEYDKSSKVHVIIVEYDKPSKTVEIDIYYRFVDLSFSGLDRMVVGFTATYAIDTYHH